MRSDIVVMIEGAHRSAQFGGATLSQFVFKSARTTAAIRGQTNVGERAVLQKALGIMFEPLDAEALGALSAFPAHLTDCGRFPIFSSRWHAECRGQKGNPRKSGSVHESQEHH